MPSPRLEARRTISRGDVSDFRELLANHPGLLDEEPSFLLSTAAACNRLDLLEFLAGKGVDVNAIDARSDTAIGAAAKKGAVEAVAWLLDHGADIEKRSDSIRPTPLLNAAMAGQLKMVKLLLDRGADPEALCGDPARNSVAIARSCRREEVATFLESQGFQEVVVERELVDVEGSEFMAEVITDPSEWFDRKWWHVYAFAEKRGIDTLCEKNLMLFLVGYLVDQVLNGGIAQVYFNPSARYVNQMPDALEQIGATQEANAIREINKLFPGGSPANDLEERSKQLEELSAEVAAKGAIVEQTVNELVTRVHQSYCS